GIASRRGAVDPTLRKPEPKVADALIERQPIAQLVVCFSWRRLSHYDLRDFSKDAYLPTPRNLPQQRVAERIWEQSSGLRVHAGRLAALHLGAHGVEVHEPALEQ